MSNVRKFIGGRAESKEDLLETAKSLLEDIESGKVTGFLCVAVDVTDATFVYSGSSADKFSRLTAIGMATRLQYAALTGELDAAV